MDERTEQDNISSASGSLASNDVGNITEDPNYNIDDDMTMQDAINRLDELNVEPDLDMSELTTEEQEHDISSVEDSKADENDKVTDVSKDGGKAKKDTKDSNTGAAKPSRKMSMFDRLKRLTKFEKRPKQSKDTNYSKFSGVKIDRLPVCFVAKYLGRKEVKGLFGLEHVRGPVDDFIDKVRDDLVSMDRVELPLCYVVFSSKGIDVRDHPSNKVKGELPLGLHSIDFISYGVQDMKYWRVFTFIAVNELGVRKKKSECHAFIADSSQNARKMALALGACFSVYKKKLASEGKAHNFQVELRPPDELAGELQNDVEA